MENLFAPNEWKHPKYVIGIASTKEEKEAVLRLRYEIFNVELDEGIRENESIQMDVDQFDEYCDHLMVKDLDTNSIIATYRIHPSWKMNKKLGFYTATEFNFSVLNLDKSRSIEMGRACIKAEHRKNNLLIVLWMGIKKYTEINKVEKLFGCVSVPKCSLEDISSLYNYLKNNDNLTFIDGVAPLKENKVALLPNATTDCRKDLISTLMKGYLRLGAKLLGEPAYDPIFGCYDFMVLLELNSVNWGYVETIFKSVDKQHFTF